MRTIEVRTARPYDVRVGSGALAALSEVLAANARAALVTDANVLRAQGDRARALGLGEPIRTLPPGEDAKSFAELETSLDAFAAAGLIGRRRRRA